MKIEKVSENQIKFVLTNEDLRMRNMKLDELAYGSEKTQELFREITERACNEYGFNTSGNVPLVIEAIPMNSGSIMIVMTKVASPEYFGESPGFNDLADGREMPSPFKDAYNALNRSAPARGMPRKRRNDKQTAGSERSGAESTPIPKQSVFAFNSFDLVVQAALRLAGNMQNNTILYKLRGKYYLAIENASPLTSANHEIVLQEYGTKLGSPDASKEISMMFLAEHGEIIIKRNAIRILAAYLS